MVIILASVALAEAIALTVLANLLVAVSNRHNLLAATLVSQVNPRAGAAISKSLVIEEPTPPRRQVGLDGGNV